MCDVENVSTYVKLMLFCGKTGFVAIFAVLLQFLRFCCKFRSFGAVYAVLSQNMFCRDCVEKN